MVIDPIPSAETPVVRDAAPTPGPLRSSGGGAAPSRYLQSEVSVQWEGEDGVIVKFTDPFSGELIRQIPPEQILSVARYIRQMLQQEKDSKGA